MSDVRQCSRCNKLYVYRHSTMCPECHKLTDRLFIETREYFYNHPDADVEEAARETGAAADEILMWLKEGRIIMAKKSATLQCEFCGEEIRTGRFCDTCLEKVKTDLQECAKVLEEEQKKDTPIKKDKASSGFYIKT